MKLHKITIILSLSLFLTACADNNSASDSQTRFPVANTSTPEDSSSSEAEQISNTNSIIIGNTSLSIYESKQDILTKLDKAGLYYSKRKSDNPEEESYDFYYYVDDASLQIYFLNNKCVRLRVINSMDIEDELPHTVQGLYTGNKCTYSQMVTLYGDSFETHSYSGKLIYTIYRYSINDCIYEFGIQEDTNYIYNIDIYLPNQSPIYDYGEEIQKTN